MTKPLPFLLLFAVLLGLSGCTDDCPDCDAIPCPEPVPAPPLRPGILLAGKPARMLIPPRLSTCAGPQDPQPSSATVEISGPDGALIPSTISVSASSTATLTFTPQQPGPHHVLIVFSPVGGLHQFDFHVARDRSAEAASLTLPQTCTRLERTLQGAWACDTTIFRDGTPVVQFSGVWLAVAGDVVWVVTERQTRRFVDTGSELVLTHAVDRPSGRVEFLLASPDELLVVQPQLLAHFTAGTQLTVATAPAAWSSLPIGFQAPAAVILRDADRVLVVTRTHYSSPTPGLAACPYLLTPSGPQRTQAACQPVPGNVVGFEPSVLWTVGLPDNPTGGAIHRWTWAAGRFEEQSSLSLPPGVLFIDRPLRGSSAVPLLRSALSPTPLTTVATWSPEQRQVLLEHLDTEITEIFVSPSFYWGRTAPSSSNNTTRVLIRPSTP